MSNGEEPKTPITLLYEYAIVRRLSPRFEVACTKHINRKPIFTACVTVGCLSEMACATSKKSAKHHAATKMLKRLNISESNPLEEGSYEMEEMTDAQVSQNYIGNLKAYCLEHRYPEAKFELEEEDGPPHRKVFKMTCSVSKLQEFGISRTKKLAKQKAAFKMMERLKKIHGDTKAGEEKSKKKEQQKQEEEEEEDEEEEEKEGEGGEEEEDEEEKEYKNINEDELSLIESAKPLKRIPELRLTDEEIFEKYKTNIIGQPSIPVTYDPAAYYRDHYKAYVSLTDTSPTISNITKGDVKFEKENALTLIEDIAAELSVNLSFTEVDVNKNKDAKYILLGMSVVPSLCGMGKSKSCAALDLLDSLSVLCAK